MKMSRVAPNDRGKALLDLDETDPFTVHTGTEMDQYCIKHVILRILTCEEKGPIDINQHKYQILKNYYSPLNLSQYSKNLNPTPVPKAGLCRSRHSTHSSTCTNRTSQASSICSPIM